MRFAGAIVVILGLAVAGCTRTDVVHRTLPPQDPLCADPLDLGPRNAEPRRAAGNPARCFLQSHLLPRPAAPGAAPRSEDWADVAARLGRDLRQAGGYHLGFVEIADSGRLHAPGQLEALAAHLRAQRATGRQNYVIAFVHGWRHDASLGDRDVQKFRTLLGYARAALNTRCAMQGRYCNATLTGVFVAWRGRSFAEPVLIADGGLNPFFLLAAPTIWDRKTQSDRLGRGAGAPLASVLDKVQAQLRLGPGRPGADRFLIFGHSLGGNMLAHLMEARAIAAVGRHPLPAPGQEARPLAPPLGDLVVLINPAAEARRWTGLQDAMRARVGLSRADNQLTAVIDGELDEALWTRLHPWRRLFPLGQRPVYVSVTATANWCGVERRGRQIAFDSATGIFFPLARQLAGARTAEGRRAIGHFVPRYASQKVLAGPAIGASHELSVNRGSGRRASYALSALPASSWCDPATGWLRAVRQDQIDAGWSYGDAWDYGLTPNEAENRLTAAANIARGINPASVQWRHSLNLRGQPNRWSVVAGRSPFWNVRALDTALREHAGYVNYPMWCALNQLVLDDVGEAGASTPTVAATRLGERLVDVEAAIAAAE